jgi:hypothetical protein
MTGIFLGSAHAFFFLSAKAEIGRQQRQAEHQTQHEPVFGRCSR